MIMNVYHPLPLILKPNTYQTALLFLLSGVFTVTGLGLASVKPLLGYLCAGFFGLCLIVFGLQFIPGSAYLELNKEGFTVCSLFRQKTVYWREIERFSVVKFSRKKMVAWDYSENSKDKATGGAFARVLTGTEAALPDTYGMKAEQLAELMNDLLERYKRLSNSGR